MAAAAVTGGVFLAFNGPFIVSNPALWLNSVLSLLKDPLFPFGTGLVTLVTFGYLKIQSSLPFLILEAAAMLAGIVWYWFKARRYPSSGRYPVRAAHFLCLAQPVALFLLRGRHPAGDGDD